MNTRWPLIGRDGVLGRIQDALWGSDGSAPAGAVVLSGRSGVGKTRLLRAVMEETRARGWSTEQVVASRAAGSIPFGAVSHLVRLWSPARPHPSRGPAESDAPVALPAHRSTLLVAVDDAHLLDDASAALVKLWAARRIATLVLSVRCDEPAPDAVAALWRDGPATVVDLGPLADDAMDELLAHALDGPVSESTRVRLRGLAAGNPLYLRELLIDGVESGTLHRHGGFWRWDGEPDRGSRLAEVVNAHVDAAGPAARTVVELVAFGEPLPMAVVAAEPGLAAAQRHGLLDVGDDGRRTVVRLAHPAFGEVVRAQLGPIQVRRTYRALVAHLRRLPVRRRDDLLRLGAWHLEAGAPADASVLVPAAREALARHDPVLAERLARRAADTGDPAASRLLAEALYWLGRHDESAALLSGDPPPDTVLTERARWYAARARTLYWGLGQRPEAARALWTARLAAARVDTTRADTIQALMALYDGDIQATLDAAIPVCLATGHPTESRLWAYTAAVSALATQGLGPQALELADRGLGLVDRDAHDDSSLALEHLRLARASAMLFAGRLIQARELAESGYRRAATTTDAGLTAQWAAVRGLVAQVRGDLATAVASLREAVDLTENHDPTRMRRVHLTVLAGILAMTADGSADDWLRRAAEVTDPVPGLYAAQVGMNRAWVAAAHREPRRAAHHARTAAGAARAAGHFAVEAFALHDAARHGQAARVAGRLARLAQRLDNDLVTAFAESAAALAAADGARLEKVAAAFDDLDAPLLAAEAMAAAVRGYRAAGKSQSAGRSQDRLRILRARCPQARTALLADDDTEPLTPRERRVAMLAAGSMRSRDIAELLHLSVRTVDNHLGRVYAKLGIAGRAELGRAFEPGD